jgi:hypothetical protein
MEYEAHAEEYKGFTIRIIQDQAAESPREDSNLGTLVGWHRRYNIGDEQPRETPEDYMLQMVRDIDEGLAERLEDESDSEKLATRVGRFLERQYIILPVYMYEHSGVMLKTSAFSCPWDSGQVGFIYVSLASVRKEYSWKVVTKARRQQSETYLSGEVEVYSDYLSGNVYGYVIEDSDGNAVDSCWGYIGDYHGYVLEEAKSQADYFAKKNRQERFARLKDLIRNRVPLHVRQQEFAA